MKTGIAAIGVTSALVAAAILDGNIAGVLGAIVTTVGLTIAVMNWIDKRIEHKIKNAAAAVEMWQFRRWVRAMQAVNEVREKQGLPRIDVMALLDTKGD